MKVAVIGGASSYTPELVKGFLDRSDSLPLRDLWLVDVSQERLEVVGGFAQRMAAAKGSPLRVHLTTDRREGVAGAGTELGDLAAGVIRQLGLERQQFDVVLAGSLFEGGALLVEPMRERVQAAAPGAVSTRLTAPPVTGAVLLGMQKAGLDASRLRQAVIASTTAYLGANPGGGAGRGDERG